MANSNTLTAAFLMLAVGGTACGSDAPVPSDAGIDAHYDASTDAALSCDELDLTWYRLQMGIDRSCTTDQDCTMIGQPVDPTCNCDLILSCSSAANTDAYEVSILPQLEREFATRCPPSQHGICDCPPRRARCGDGGCEAPLETSCF